MDFGKIALAATKLVPYKKVLLWPVMKKFVAGENIASFAHLASELNSLGFSATADPISEENNLDKDIKKAGQGDLETLQAIQTNVLNSDLAVKPSKYGILCTNDFQRMVWRRSPELFATLDAAKELKIRPFFDAEKLATRRDTWQLVKFCLSEQMRIGCALQAYARDCEYFFKEVVAPVLGNAEKFRFKIRVCKGAYYRESEHLIYKDRSAVIREFFRLASLVLDAYKANPSFEIQFATHDEMLIDFLKELIEKRGVLRQDIEFAFLFGRRQTLASHLLQSGFKVRIYLPFGPRESCFNYFRRRVLEKPQYLLWPSYSEGEYHHCADYPICNENEI